MSDQDDITAVLSQVVEIGPTPQEAELGAAVSRLIADRPSAQRQSDPIVAETLRSLADTCPTCGRPYQGD